MLKYKLGFSFETNHDINIRDGLILKGTQAFIEEINENECDSDSNITPYRIFFYDCVVGDNGELLKDDEGTQIGGTDWFSEEQLNEMIEVQC